MDIQQLRREAEAAFAKWRPGGEPAEIRLEKLFGKFRALDAELEAAGGEGDEGRAERLIDAQTPIMRAASAIRADTMKGVLYKLALCRWDWSDLDQPSEELMRYEALALSAFIDLAAMLRMASVLKDSDREWASASKPRARGRSERPPAAARTSA